MKKGRRPRKIPSDANGEGEAVLRFGDGDINFRPPCTSATDYLENQRPLHSTVRVEKTFEGRQIRRFRRDVNARVEFTATPACTTPSPAMRKGTLPNLNQPVCRSTRGRKSKPPSPNETPNRPAGRLGGTTLTVRCKNASRATSSRTVSELNELRAAGHRT